MASTYYDVLIIGGGIVGLTLANLLAQANLTTAVVDQLELTSPPLTDNYELRVSAITHASQRLFRHIDAWHAMVSSRASAYTKMSVWDASSEAHLDFDARQMAEANLGYIIENAIIQRALLQKLTEFPHVHLLANTALERIKQQSDAIEVTLSNGQVITAALLVGADGINSKLRELAGIALDYKAYGHDAIVATVHSEKSHQQTARQCFSADGILAFLPLADLHTCSIVWSCNSTVAERLLKLDNPAFAAALEDSFAKHLGKITVLSKRLSFPLAMRHARYYVAPRIALVGDAAHTIHPLAGQGLNLGLADVESLAQVIITTRQKQRDIGLLANLRAYERWRQKENLSMIIAMQGFKDLFGSSWPPLIWLRGKGLRLIDKTPWLKQFFVQQANYGRGALETYYSEQKDSSL
jgi:2-octaprenylphenol hydroxylase